jgi:hypothetical protein
MAGNELALLQMCVLVYVVVAFVQALKQTEAHIHQHRPYMGCGSKWTTLLHVIKGASKCSRKCDVVLQTLTIVLASNPDSWQSTGSIMPRGV